MLGVGRDTAPDSGSGVELYVIIGHAPRQLDRNVTLTGRVVRGIELLSSLPRGTGNLGFYEQAEQYVPIRSITVAADLPSEQRINLQLLRSDAPIFADYLRALRSRTAAWFVGPPIGWRFAMPSYRCGCSLRPAAQGSGWPMG